MTSDLTGLYGIIKKVFEIFELLTLRKARIMTLRIYMEEMQRNHTFSGMQFQNRVIERNTATVDMYLEQILENLKCDLV